MDFLHEGEYLLNDGGVSGGLVPFADGARANEKCHPPRLSLRLLSISETLACISASHSLYKWSHAFSFSAVELQPWIRGLSTTVKLSNRVQSAAARSAMAPIPISYRPWIEVPAAVKVGWTNAADSSCVFKQPAPAGLRHTMKVIF